MRSVKIENQSPSRILKRYDDDDDDVNDSDAHLVINIRRLALVERRRSFSSTALPHPRATRLAVSRGMA